MDYNQLDEFYPELNIYSNDSKILSLIMSELNSSGNVIYNIDFDSLVKKYDDLDIRVENMYVDNNKSNNQINPYIMRIRIFLFPINVVN